MKVVYLAQENADKTEGRGPMVTFAAFANKIDAERAVKKRGAMDGQVVELIVYQYFDEWSDDIKKALRESAIEKLSPAEREAIGLYI